MEALHELRWHASYNVITGASDGSVRDYRQEGTWAWTIMTTDPPEPWPIQGRGREYIHQKNGNTENTFIPNGGTGITLSIDIYKTKTTLDRKGCMVHGFIVSDRHI